MRRSDTVAKTAHPARSTAVPPRPLLALQCVSACAGTTLGSTVGSGTIGKLITSAGGALITAFLTAPGRHHPRRIMAVGLALALLQEGRAFAATVRHPRARRPRISVLPRPARLLVTVAVAVIGFSAGWAVVASPFVASPSSGERAVIVAMHMPKPPSAPAPARVGKRPPPARSTSTAARTPSPPAARTPFPPAATPVPARKPTGPTLVLVPSIAGQTLSAGQTSLHGAGFTTSTSSQPSPQVPSGVVISTDPTGGSRAPSGSAVQIVVSSGPVQVTVPDVTGMPVKSALGVLRAAGFTPTVSLAPSQSVPSGDVIMTTPAPKTPVAPGSPVAVLAAS